MHVRGVRADRRRASREDFSLAGRARPIFMLPLREACVCLCVCVCICVCMYECVSVSGERARAQVYVLLMMLCPHLPSKRMVPLLLDDSVCSASHSRIERSWGCGRRQVS